MVSDPYKLLGVPEDADDTDIRKAYRALALLWHPDKHPPAERPAAEQEFKAISEAYQLLSDPQQRSRYDHERVASVFCQRTPRNSKCNSTAPNARRRQASAPNASPAGWAQRKSREGDDHDASAASAKTWAGTVTSVGLPPSCRIWFARGSACIGRAYKGLENPELAEARQKLLTELSHWVGQHPAVVIDIRGCSEAGEVSTKQLSSLAKARGEHAFKFLTGTCGLPPGRCRLSHRLGEEHQGVEFRALARCEGDVSFAQGATELLGHSIVDAVIAEALKGGLRQRVLVEVAHAGEHILARQRCAVLKQIFLSHGLPHHMLSLRSVGESQDGEQVNCYLYEELPPLKESKNCNHAH